MSEKQTSELKKQYQFWSDQAGLVFLRAPDTSMHGWENGLHVNHGLSKPTAERLHDELSKILNRSPDPRMLEVLREARELINDDTKCENNTDPIGNCDDLWPYTKKLCRRCKLRYRIDAVLGGSHKVEPFKEGSD